MHNLVYLIVLFFTKLFGDEHKNKYFRKKGILIGDGCHIYSNILTSEPYLIKIGSNVTISTNVTFCTHDNSIIKLDKKLPNLYGEIIIGDNCFVGENAILMYGITLPNNTIVAAGSVVTKSPLQEKTIIGGNPAKFICSWDDFYKKRKDNGISRKDIKRIYQTNPDKLIKR